MGKEMQGQEVYDLFMKPNVITVDKDTLQQREPQRDAIFKLMVEEHEFSIERVDSSLSKIIDTSISQQGLSKWF